MVVLAAAVALPGCEPETVGDRIPADLDGAWQGSGFDEPSGQIRIALKFYLEDEDGRVSGTGSVGNMGRGTERLSIDGAFADAELELVITDTITGENVVFDGWASADEMKGTLRGDPLVFSYDATLRKLTAP